MLDHTTELHVLRDPTRGGLAAALNELAEASRVGIEFDEAALPVPEPLRAACGFLGLDPIHVANEGKLVAFVPPEDADAVLAAMRAPGRARRTRHRPVMAEHPGIVSPARLGATRVRRPPARRAAPPHLLNQPGSSGLGLLAPGAFRRTDEHGVGTLAIALPGIRVGADRHHVAIVPSRDAERRELLR